MSQKKYVLVVSEITPKWVKLNFEDGDFITISKDKLPEKIHVGQVIEITIKTTTILTILKEIENIAKKEKGIERGISRSMNK